jgi:hypothetical protein
LNFERLAMYDFDLHMRFVRSATDAFFQTAEATMAAMTAWPDMLPDQHNASAAPAAAMFNPFAWLQPQPAMPFAGAAMFDPFGWLQSPAVTPFSAAPLFDPFAWLVPPTAPSFWKAPSAFAMSMPTMPVPYALPESLSAWWSWPATSWVLFQTPLTAMMMSAGWPLSVAGPAARASTSAMDAADAARQQMMQAFAAYRSDGGLAASQMFDWTMPFSAATSAGGFSFNSTPRVVD